MLAARFYGAGDIRIEEIKKPRISKDEILVKVKSLVRDRSEDVPARLGQQCIPAHYARARVQRRDCGGGAEVSHYTEGMEVVVAPNMGCGVCRQCVQGNTHHCGL